MIGAALRYPATVGATTTAALLAGFFGAAAALSRGAVPSYVTSDRQLVGMVLMLIILPSYLVATSVISVRRSLEFVDQLRRVTPSAASIDEAAGAIQGALKNSWVWGGLVGFAMAPFNSWLLLETVMSPSADAIVVSLWLGQYILWISVGLALGMRVVAARAFSRLGEVVEIDLFNPERLRPLAHSRLLDVVVIAGGLALTALQSLDAEFRLVNYQFAAIVMTPAAVLMLLWPLRSVHRRIRAAKQSQLARIGELVSAASSDRSSDGILRLETLLAHRERVRGLTTWPLDTLLLSKFALYVVIPPLAWVCAAIVENIVSAIAAG